MKDKRPHIRKVPPVLPRIVVLFFLLMVLLFMNADSLSRLLNSNRYDKVTATVIRPDTDDFLLIIPTVQIRYRYEGNDYETEKYFLLQPLFGLSRETGKQLDIYVNTLAPDYCLFRVNFFRNMANWVILALIGVCIHNIARHIRKKKEVQDEK